MKKFLAVFFLMVIFFVGCSNDSSVEVKTEKIPYETIKKDISDGAESTKNKVLQEGEEGIKEITYKVKYQNDTEIERKKIAENIIKEPINKIVQVNSIVVTSRLM